MNFRSKYFISRLFLLLKLFLLEYEEKVRKLTQHKSHNSFLTYFNLENNEKFKEFTIK